MNVKKLAIAAVVVALAVVSRDAMEQAVSDDQELDEWTPETGEDEQTNIFQDVINVTRDTVFGNEIAEVIEAGIGYLVVRRPDGRVQRLKGSRNWRNNNPGNIEYGNFTRSMGAIGTDGRFAIFPTYEAGRRAKEALIFEGGSYRSLTLSAAIARYAPPVENDTGTYQKNVIAAVGEDKPMSEYSDAERSKILAAMERMEGFKPGTVTDVA